MLEVLESRIAPAVLLNPSTVTYTDFDGDEIQIKFSKPLFKGSSSEIQALLNQVFIFSDGQTHDDPFTPQQLHSIDLSGLPVKNGKSVAHGVSISITSKQISRGDGFAHVGVIDAGGVSLGTISITGDLGKITAGDGITATGLKALTVHSLGKAFGTQIGTPDLQSEVQGAIGSLKVFTDIENAHIYAQSATSPAGKSLPGNIGKILIGGVLQGSADPALARDLQGVIQADGDIGSVLFTDFDKNSSEEHGIHGGFGRLSGAILAAGKIGTVTMEAPSSVRGGAGEQSGTIVAKEIGTLKNKGGGGFDVLGSTGDLSGTIVAEKIGSIAIGYVMGGEGERSGVLTVTGAIGSASFEAIVGGEGLESGRVEAASIKSLQVTGFLSKFAGDVFLQAGIVGGAGTESGVVDISGTIKKLNIPWGIAGWELDSGGLIAGDIGKGQIARIAAGFAPGSGFVDVAGDVGSLTIGGLLGGQEGAGILNVGGAIGSLTVRGSLLGGSGVASGSVAAAGGIQKLSISRGAEVPEGEIYKTLGGGTGELSGSVLAGGLGQVTIKGEIFGGDGVRSGSLVSTAGIGKLSMPGKGLAAMHAGVGEQSASIISYGPIGTVAIDGMIDAGPDSGPQSASIIARDFVSTEGSLAGSIKKISLGLVYGGGGHYSGQIAADGNIGSVYVELLTGGVGDFSGSISSGLGSIEAGDIGKLDVRLSRYFGAGDGAGGVWIEGSLKTGKIGRYLPGFSLDPMKGMTIAVGGSIGKLNLTAIDEVTLLAGEIGKLTIDSKGHSDPNTQGPAPAVRDSLIAATRITSLQVKGDVDGSVFAVTGHPSNKPAIGTLTVNGNVEFSTLLAGYGANLTLLNPDVQVGAVTVTGNWVASSLSAGIAPGNGWFGDSDDFALAGAPDIVSRIASITIKGSVTGTLESDDHFGIVAQSFGKVSINGKKVTPASEVFLAADTTLRIPSVQMANP